MSGFAWVTLATNDSYSLGALVLAHSLRQTGTVHQLAVLITPGVTKPMREKLATVFTVVQEVNVLDSKDAVNLRLLKRPELGITFTKLHCWRLTQFEKCVFLDADTLVLKNVDDLFDREEFSAAPDVGWPDCFNSGVFVYKPSNDTYDKLVQFALDKGSFDGGDQGLLNLYFSDWAHKDINKHLPFIYNMCSTSCYSYLPAFKQFGSDVKIIHFISSTKPWLQFFDTISGKVQPSPEMQHLKEVLQHWWDIFCSLIHPTLSADMKGGTTNDSLLQDLISTGYVHPSICNDPLTSTTNPSNYQNVWDPWDDYNVELEINQLDTNKQIESLNTSYDSGDELSSLCLINSEINEISERSSIPNISPSPIDLPHNCSNPASPSPEAVVHKISKDSEEPELDESNDHIADTIDNGGLAGAFAQFTLGSPRSPTQNVLEDQLRRQGWEAGNIDYMGSDSFDNIWSKICETLGTPQGDTKPAEAATIADADPVVQTVITEEQAASETKVDVEIVHIDSLNKTDEPVKADEPVITEELVKTDETVKADKLIKTDETVKADEPVKAEKLVIVDEPVKAVELVKADEPVKAEKLVKADEPVKADELVKTDEPVKAEELAKAVESITTEELVKADEPIKAEESVKAEQPIKTEETVKIEDVVTTKELAQEAAKTDKTAKTETITHTVETVDKPETVKATEIAESPLSVCPKTETETECPLSVCPKTDAATECPLSVCPKTEAVTECPLSVCLKAEAATECPLSICPKTEAATECPVSVCPKTEAATECPLPVCPKTEAAAECPLSVCPKTEAATECPLSVCPKTETKTECPLSVCPKTDAATECPLSVCPKSEAAAECPLSVCSKKEAAAECPLSVCPKTEAATECPLSVCPKMEAATECPLSICPKTEATPECPLSICPKTEAAIVCPLSVCAKPKGTTECSVAAAAETISEPAETVCPLTCEKPIVHETAKPDSSKSDLPATIADTDTVDPEIVKVEETKVESDIKVEATDLPIKVDIEAKTECKVNTVKAELDTKVDTGIKTQATESDIKVEPSKEDAEKKVTESVPPKVATKIGAAAKSSKVPDAPATAEAKKSTITESKPVSEIAEKAVPEAAASGVAEAAGSAEQAPKPPPRTTKKVVRKVKKENK